MPLAHANGIDLFYDSTGDEAAPAILLIMGWGTQMTAWPTRLCELLADRGFRVVRFDNRDSGLSTKLGDAPRYDLQTAFLRAATGQRIDSIYGLEDMANDAVGLMDALSIASAHVVGASMGGMIAQILAATHRERCRSLVSIMSTSGDPTLPAARPSAAAALTAPSPSFDAREACIQFGMMVRRAIGSPAYPVSDADLRAEIEAAFDRSYYPAGIVRQLLAVLSSGSRANLLATIEVPTLVLHGDDDPLAPVECGIDTARRIPGATLKTIPGWGHDLPAELLPTLAEAIADHCRRADAVRAREAGYQPVSGARPDAA